MPLTNADRAKVLDLHAEGLSPKEIASQLRRSIALVFEALGTELHASAEEETESDSGRNQSGYGCDVRGCPNRKDDLDGEGQPITFFSFPKDTKLKKAWESATRRSSEDGKGAAWKSKPSSMICSEHFSTEDFRPDHSSKTSLMHGVVPSVNLPGQDADSAKRPVARTVRRSAAAAKTASPKREIDIEANGTASSSEKPPLRPASSRIAAKAAAGFAARVEGVPPAKRAKTSTPARTQEATDQETPTGGEAPEMTKEIEDWRFYQKLEADRQSSVFLFPQAVAEAKLMEAERPEGTSFLFEPDKIVVTRVWFGKQRELHCRSMVAHNDLTVMVWEDGLRYAGHKVYGIPGTASSAEALRTMVATLPDIQLGATQDIINLQSVVGRMLKKLRNISGNGSDAMEEDEDSTPIGTDMQKESLDGLQKFLEFTTEQLTLLSWPKHGRRFTDQAPATLSIATKLKQYSQPGYEWLKNYGPIVFPCGVTIERDLGKNQSDEAVVHALPNGQFGQFSGSLRVTVAVPHAFPALRPSPEPKHEQSMESE